MLHQPDRASHGDGLEPCWNLPAHRCCWLALSERLGNTYRGVIGTEQLLACRRFADGAR